MWARVAALSLGAIMIGGIAWKAHVMRQRERQQVVALQRALAAQQKPLAMRNQIMARQAAAVRAATNPSR
jgi:hypothetical protein